MSQPISDPVKQRMDQDLISLVAGGISLPAYLRSLFDGISKYRGIDTPIESGFAHDESESNGLDFAFTGGRYHWGRGGLQTIAAGYVTLADNDTNYVYVDPSDNTVKDNTTGFTSDMLPLFEVTTAGGEIDEVERVLPRLMIVGDDVLDANLLRPYLPGDNVHPVPPVAVAWELEEEGGDAREVSFTIHYGDESPLEGTRIVEVFLADTGGGWLTSTAADGGISTDVNATIETLDAGKRLRVKILSAGSYFGSITISHSGTKTWYVGLIVGDQVFYSPALAFA